MNDFNDGEIVIWIFKSQIHKGVYSKIDNVVYGIDFLVGVPKISPEYCSKVYISDVQELIENYQNQSPEWETPLLNDNTTITEI